MIILLDTCAALWIMENDWLRPEAVAAIDEAYDRGEKVRVSPITGWEIGIVRRPRSIPVPLYATDDG